MLLGRFLRLRVPSASEITQEGHARGLEILSATHPIQGEQITKAMAVNNSLPVQIKANRDGYILVPDSESSFTTILDYMEKRLGESHDFFQNSEMILDLRKKALNTDEVLVLHRLLKAKAGVKLVEVRLEDDLSFLLERRPVPPAAPPRAPASDKADSSPLIVRGTCRSGSHIESPADCIILGDVNPGAEILAVGDIVVFGSLRGVAHAGATGNIAARIWALSIEPSQIRIADMVALPPRGNKPTPKRFEIAEIRENMIQVITV